MRLFALSALFLFIAVAQTQPAPSATPPEPQINVDHTVTFRLTDPTATKVEMTLDTSRTPFPMTRDALGVWTYTSAVLPAALYSYHFVVDGRVVIDARNPMIKSNLVNADNGFLVPGETPQPWEAADIAHGEVHGHSFASKIVVGLERGQDEYFVYTPPNYDPRGKQKYPVLYLLHGWSDAASGWWTVGKANFILDSLIASGKAKPMIVVMPLGYGDMSFVRSGGGVWQDGAAIDHNVDLFQRSLLMEVIPQVEAAYNVAPGRENRAIAGLSMGGLESLSVGLKNPTLFAYVGGFSSAVHHLQTSALGTLNPKAADLRLLWIACGTSDDLMKPNRTLIADLTAKGFAVMPIETPGIHSWLVWRDNLTHFVPLLFQPPAR
jgi:enterochelin esterase-like enzyme